jgi:hypothetical protein
MCFHVDVRLDLHVRLDVTVTVAGIGADVRCVHWHCLGCASVRTPFNFEASEQTCVLTARLFIACWRIVQFVVLDARRYKTLI